MAAIYMPVGAVKVVIALYPGDETKHEICVTLDQYLLKHKVVRGDYIRHIMRTAAESVIQKLDERFSPPDVPEQLLELMRQTHGKR